MAERTKIFVILAVGAILLLPIFGFAAKDDQYGLSETARKTKLITMNISESTPELLAAQIITVGLGFVGTIFFILVLYGGITWMTAMGSTEKVNRAKTILQAAFIGLVVVAASYAISTYIFTRLTGSGGEVNCQGQCISNETDCPKGAAEGVCTGGQKCCAL